MKENREVQQEKLASLLEIVSMEKNILHTVYYIALIILGFVV